MAASSHLEINLGPSCGHLDTILGYFRAILGPLGPPRRHLGGNSSHLGAMLGHPGTSWTMLGLLGSQIKAKENK